MTDNKELTGKIEDELNAVFYVGGNRIVYCWQDVVIAAGLGGYDQEVEFVCDDIPAFIEALQVIHGLATGEIEDMPEPDDDQPDDPDTGE